MYSSYSSFMRARPVGIFAVPPPPPPPLASRFACAVRGPGSGELAYLA
jgi:hypothetical protein